MFKQLIILIIFVATVIGFNLGHCGAKETDTRQAVNVVFGLDPGPGHYNAVVGKPRATWNLLDVGQTKLKSLLNAKGQPTDCHLQVSENDGEWGIEGHVGVYHAYIYHNQQNVDLQARFKGLASGDYRAYAYAHGDASNQNAMVELLVGQKSVARKATANDGTDAYRSMKLKEGLQYVVFEFSKSASEVVRIISHRDGSSYSMLNAIQIIPVQ